MSGCSPIVCVEPPAEETYDYNVTVYPGDDERAVVDFWGCNFGDQLGLKNMVS